MRFSKMVGRTGFQMNFYIYITGGWFLCKKDKTELDFPS